ncbi:TB2/DP1, HVA22 family-domain-containing protein [Annulohypoxylon maeteangense]|uniref:TB2/DP1, HVA22 family-domain-containing protein n=1 Tax=Annulohypoxylon maeteangense TaxID=1927788 RepID=UPI00200773C2|nr:TB2/DP1, HVA22 family-domain-containing protein [Annulohypoxylon maeteangense]KAI0887856.1 TB2/DP1, HVA22 family-domain-containing protein [Annulohypoxylon maeteangense]
MFDLIPKLLSSVASFLFPLFASYKALKTSDPAQLTPWLMYWSVLSCALLVESWTEFILWWVPFYSYMRLGFLLYLVLPQTQGARVLYETYLYPYLEENETAIEDFIASAHDRLKAAGIAYLKRAIEMLRTQVLGMPPREVEQEDTRATAAPQGYTQALLARFSVPAARWAANNTDASGGPNFYNMLAGAVGAAASSFAPPSGNQEASTATLIPENIGGAEDKINFIVAQKEKLALMMGALDKEARQLEERKAADQAKKELRPSSMSLDGQDSSRPPSGHSVWSGLSKSRSEVDFEKIDAESGAEEDEGTLRRRGTVGEPSPGSTRSGWSFLGWGTVGTGQAPGTSEPDTGRSSGIQK